MLSDKNGTMIAMPYVIKPVSDGIKRRRLHYPHSDDLQQIDYQDEDREILIEKYIEGKELTVSVLRGKSPDGYRNASEKRFYDYRAKYTDGVTDHVIPAEIPEAAYNTGAALCRKNCIRRSVAIRSRAPTCGITNMTAWWFWKLTPTPGMTPFVAGAGAI